MSLYYINIYTQYVLQEVSMSYWKAYKKVASTNLAVFGLVVFVALVAAIVNPKTRQEVERRFKR